MSLMLLFLITYIFRLILIAEKTTVYEEFPTPLINRLEKHFVLYSSVLEDWQTCTLERVKKWIKDFSDVRDSNSVYVGSDVYIIVGACMGLLCVNDHSRFKEKDAFVGYQNDVAAAVVFQASSQLRRVQKRYVDEDISSRRQLWESSWENGLLGDSTLRELALENEGSDKWQEAVSIIPKDLHWAKL